MNRLACLLTGGLTLLGVACSSGSSQSVTAPTVVAPTPSPTPLPSAPTPVTGIVLTQPTDPRAGIAAFFPFTVTGVPLNDLTVAWGDQTMTDVGAATQGVLSHVYMSAGAYILTITAKDAGGGSEVVQSGPLLVK